MRPLARSALIGTTISLSLTLAFLTKISPLVAILIWAMGPGFLLVWGASVMLHGTDAAPLAFGNGLILILTTIGNAIFYCCASLFFLRSRRDG